MRLSLERLKRVGYGAFAPLVMAALQKKSTSFDLHEFLLAAERFVFIVSRLCARRSDTGDSEFYRLAGELHRDERTLTEVTNIVMERTKEHFSIEKAQVEMRDLFDGDEGFYGWSGLNYFLFEYEQQLKVDAGMQAAKMNWDEFTTSKRDHVTVEHIYPRLPVFGNWPSFEAQPPEKRAILQSSLGNLLALSQSKNSRLSNRPFSSKKQNTNGVRGYFNGSYSEIEVSKETAWTPEAVLERGLKMLDFLEHRWDVSLGIRHDKLKLLNLEFMDQVPAAVTPDPAIGG
ncbi:MAG TPA: HNH endonuclease family protein [Chthoniobacterales bacterium]|nr:HNH endonuclease family protein [Chthoniobacterales bacterium]